MRGHGRIFARAKGKQQILSRFDSYSFKTHVYWSHPILPFGIVVCTVFATTFLKIAVYDGE